MFWFTRNRLLGSYFFFRLATRSKLSPYVAFIRLYQVVDGEPVSAVRQPWSPLRVRLATPVVETTPNGIASPKAWVAWSTSPVTQPASTRVVRLTESTRTMCVLVSGPDWMEQGPE